jgi:hypothetical protein
VTEPWTDYFAFPLAPLALLCQIAAMFVKQRPRRLALSVGGWGAITAMQLYLPEPDPDAGVDIGGPLLELQWYLSILLLAIALILEAVRHFANRS